MAEKKSVRHVCARAHTYGLLSFTHRQQHNLSTSKTFLATLIYVCLKAGPPNQIQSKRLLHCTFNGSVCFFFFPSLTEKLNYLLWKSLTRGPQNGNCRHLTHTQSLPLFLLHPPMWRSRFRWLAAFNKTTETRRTLTDKSLFQQITIP